MPSRHRRPSDSGSDNDTLPHDRHRSRHPSPSKATPSRRRAASLSAGRHPGLHARHSYHRDRNDDDDGYNDYDYDSDNYGRTTSRSRSRPSHGRNSYFPGDSDGSDSDSEGGDRRHRTRTLTRPRSPPRTRSRSQSTKPSRASSPASHRSGSGDHHDNRGRHSSSRNRERYYPPSASRSRHGTFPQDKSSSKQRPPQQRRRSNSSDAILLAGRTAFEAGAVAALKLRDDPGPWLGPKGAKIAAAALSAAVVDTFMEQRHPERKGGLRHTMMRQATQLMIGNLVMKPAVEEVRGGKREKVRVREGVKDGIKGGVKAGLKDGAKGKVKERAHVRR